MRSKCIPVLYVIKHSQRDTVQGETTVGKVDQLMRGRERKGEGERETEGD